MDSQHAECREYREAIKRNLERARRRLPRGHAKAKAGSSAQIRDESGNISREPSDGERIPPASKGTLAGHSLCPELGSNWNYEKEGNQGGTCPNPNAPKREGGTLPGADSQRQQLNENANKERQGQAFSEKRCVGRPEADIVVTITTEDITQGGRRPHSR